MNNIKFWLLVAAIVFFSVASIPDLEAGQRAEDFDTDMDGKLDRWEQQQYEEATGELANDLRGGMNLEPQSMRPYNPIIQNGEDKIEY